MPLKNKALPAFTVLESLLTLAVTCFIVFSLSGVVGTVFQKVEEKLFFDSFENLYRDTQRLAHTRQTSLTLTISQGKVSNQEEMLPIPQKITPMGNYEIVFDKAGGNSSLSKLTFATQETLVSYQLYLGSGNVKKTETKRLHTP